MKTVKLTIAYDGQNYSGWQRQINTSNTIEEKVEDALSKLLGQEINVEASGRTDKGVHALGQVASFKADFSIPVNRIPDAIRGFLPEDIVIISAQEMDSNFHARYCSKGKKYLYKIYNNSVPNPIYRNYSYYIKKPIDIDELQRAAKYFIGKHDFKGFMTGRTSVKTTVRNIYNIDVYKKDDFIILEYNGDGFLYNMVRIITGTLVEVCIGKKDINTIPTIISSKDRNKAGHTAPAHGLYLAEVYY